MSANVLNKKLELIQWISGLDDRSVIDKIDRIRMEETKDWWDSVSEQEQKSVEYGLKEANKGKVKAHSAAKKLYEKWL